MKKEELYNPEKTGSFVMMFGFKQPSTYRPNKSNTKMKWELNKTWKTALRLKTWAANQKKWDKPKSNPKSMSKLDAQINEWQKAKEVL